MFGGGYLFAVLTGHGSLQPAASRASWAPPRQVEQPIQFWRSGVGWKADWEQLKYRRHREVLTAYQWWTNVMSNIILMPQMEKLGTHEKGGRGGNRVVPPKQMSYPWMNDRSASFRRHCS